MQHKIIISVKRPDGAEISRTLNYNPDTNYQEVVESIINTLEKEL